MIKIDNEQRQENIKRMRNEKDLKNSKILLDIKNQIIKSYNSGDKDINIIVNMFYGVFVENQCYDYEQPAKKIINSDLNNAPNIIKELFADTLINNIINTYTFRRVYTAYGYGREYEYCLIFK